MVTFVCDTGAKYLSKLYNEYWMRDQGYTDRAPTHDLRDLIARNYDEGAVITVSPDQPLMSAFQRMRIADVSQVPVMENGRCVGMLDESDVLLAVHGDESKFREEVRTAMTRKLETISPAESIDKLYGILDRGLVALVLDGEHFLGVITRADLLSYLRRKLQ